MDLKKISDHFFLRRSRELKKTNSIIKRINIKPPLPDMDVTNLSGGNAQKVVLGKWLTSKRKLYLFDEVTTGIDIGTKFEIYKLMENLANSGSTILLATSDIEEALRVCTRILVIFKGTLVKDLTNTNYL